jgi:hypothetical protein
MTNNIRNIQRKASMLWRKVQAVHIQIDAFKAVFNTNIFLFGAGLNASACILRLIWLANLVNHYMVKFFDTILSELLTESVINK